MSEPTCFMCPNGDRPTVRESRDANIASMREFVHDWLPAPHMEMAYQMAAAIFGWDTRHTQEHIDTVTAGMFSTLSAAA